MEFMGRNLDWYGEQYRCPKPEERVFWRVIYHIMALSSYEVQEAMSTAFRRRPGAGIESTWQAYTEDELTLVEASAIMGVSSKQFLEIGSRCISHKRAEIPESLISIATTDEKKLLTFLSERQIELLRKAQEKDIILPMNKTFVTALWEDLHLLEAFSLLVAHRQNGIWRYTLIMGEEVKGTWWSLFLTPLSRNEFNNITMG